MNESDEFKAGFTNSSVTKHIQVYFPELLHMVPEVDVYSDSMSLTEKLVDSQSLEFVGCISTKFEIDIRDFGVDIKDQYSPDHFTWYLKSEDGEEKKTKKKKKKRNKNNDSEKTEEKSDDKTFEKSEEKTNEKEEEKEKADDKSNKPQENEELSKETVDENNSPEEKKKKKGKKKKK